jgi:hypothetical protein
MMNNSKKKPEETKSRVLAMFRRDPNRQATLMKAE